MKHRVERPPNPPATGRAGSRRRRRSPQHPAWIASLGVLALLAAGLGWTLVPSDETNDGSATVEAAAARIRPHHTRPTPKPTATARPGTPTIVPSAGATPGDPRATSSGSHPVTTTTTTTTTTRPATAPAPTTRAPQVPSVPAAPVVPAGGGGGSVPGGMSGVSAGSLTQLRAWEAFRGSPASVVMTFAARDSWKNMTNPWIGSGPEKFSTFAGTWVISQPFFPTGGGDMNSCANGAYSSQWAAYGRWLVAKGRPATITRLAWEFNGNWFPWSVSKTSATTWVNCFRQVVSAIRSTDPQARIDWALNAHSGGAWSVYPGDAYVDIIGIDSYDQWPASTSDAAFTSQCNQDTGLCSVIRFARQHGKQFSVPEWGLVGRSDTGAGRAGAAGGDNPVYIRNMYNTFKANKDVLAYESYFNDSAAGNVHSSLINPTENPSGAATYASLW